MVSSTRFMLRKRSEARDPKPQKPRRRSPKMKETVTGNDDVLCRKCGSGDNADELLLCDGCDSGFHLYCLKPALDSVPKGVWFCRGCDHKKVKNFPLVQTKIVDFFRIQRLASPTENAGQDAKKRKKRSAISVSKKKRKLLAYKPTEDADRRLEQMASLATALTDTGAQFSNELTYLPGIVPRSANRAAHEREGMQKMSKEDAETLKLCKAMMARGECPPLMVILDPAEGFTVVADRFIKDLTIITEYVGDVDWLKKREDDYKGDSMMTLLTAANPDKSLVICPDKRSNIARFINGINNHSPDGKKKQNVKCVRYDVEGEARVLLVACKDIRTGERLYYDYNGYENEYPTEDFV